MELTIKNGSKNLGDKEILKNINLRFEDNLIYAIVGENGSGKTMLLRALIGLLILDDGEVVCKEKIIGKDIDFLENIGIILGNMNLLHDYNAIDNLKLLQNVDNKENMKNIKEALDVVGLYENQDKIKKYSLGMHQRLIFAQAIMNSPEILLLDEPTNGMDENYAKRTKEKILNMKEKNRIIIITSHDKFFVEEIADKIIKIKNGEIIENE